LRLLETQYSRMAGPDLRASIDAFVEDLLVLAERDEKRPIAERLAEVARRRTGQGFSPADFLHASLSALPVPREHVRAVGPRERYLAA
jgi:hypothetical protein